MLEKQNKNQNKTQTQNQVNKKSSKKSLNNSITRKYVLFILTCLLVLSSLTMSLAWYNGIRFNLGQGTNSLTISKLSSLYENVDVIGYSYNEDYDANDSTKGTYLLSTTFLTQSDMQATTNPTNKSLFSGDSFEPGAINKLSSQTTEAVNSIIDQNTNTKYIKVVNRSDLDVSVKIQFILNDGYDSDDLDCFWYLTTEVTAEVNAASGTTLDEKLYNYAENNKASRSNDFNENNVDAKIFTGLTKKVKLGEIDEPADSSNPNISFYRIDYGLCESALRSSGSNYFGRNIKADVYLFYGQTNATDEEDIEVHSEIRQVATALDLQNALSNVTTTYNGDTIQFTDDITIEGDLNINRPFNFDLNGHTLTIHNGSLIINHNSSLAMNFNLTKNGKINIICDFSDSTSDPYANSGNLDINTPNGSVTFSGDNLTSSGESYADIFMQSKNGTIYCGCCNNGNELSTGGLQLQSTYIVKKKFNTVSGTVIDDQTTITIKDDGKLVVGEFVNIDLVRTDEITAACVYNYGNVGNINFSSLQLTNRNALKLYLYNNGYIGGYTDPTTGTTLSYDVLIPAMASEANTKIVKGPLSNNFVLYGSQRYTMDNVIDESDETELVVEIENEPNAYYVYLNANTPTYVYQGTDTKSKIAYALHTKWNDNSLYSGIFSTITKLVVIAKKGVYIDENDIAFLHHVESSTDTTVYTFRSLEYLDLSSVSIRTSNSSTNTYTNNYLADSAFEGMSNLKTVVLPEDLVYIGQKAFYGTGVTSITIPSNIIQIGSNAFNNVTEATLLCFNPVNDVSLFLRAFTRNCYFFVDEDAVDSYKTAFATYRITGATFKNHVYCYATALDEFYVRVLDSDARSLEIVAYIGDAYGTNVTPSTLEFEGIDYYVTSIGRDAYINMTNTNFTSLKLNIGEYVTNIGQEAFINLDFITSVTALSGKTIGDKAFYNNDALTKINIGGAATLGKYSFASCELLKEISLEKCVVIGESAFADDVAITDLSIPKVYEIGTKAFDGCKNFEKVEFGEIATLSNDLFNNCINLQTVKLSSTTTEIGARVFYGCKSLTSICSLDGTLVANTITLNNITKIGANAFDGCVLINYIQAPELLELGSQAFSGCKAVEYASMPKVTKIGDSAFSSITTLTQVNMASVVEIGAYAFYSTGLRYIDIPVCTTIGASAFRGCSNVLEITFGNPTSIGNYAFSGIYPKYIDLSTFDFSGITTETVFGGSDLWHSFTSATKFYYNSSITSEQLDILYNCLRNSYYKGQKIENLTEEEEEELEELYNTGDDEESYMFDQRGNISTKYFFGKEYFACSWLIESSDHYLEKDIYSYNIQVTENAGVYTGTIVSYHGKNLVGNVVIPFETYEENGLASTVYGDQTNAIYNGKINVTINGVVQEVTITTIGSYAFENVGVTSTETSADSAYAGDSFVHLTFANSIKTIKEGAFRYSKVQFIEMNQVYTIEASAFRNMTGLRYVDLGETETIGEYAFSSYLSDSATDDIAAIYTRAKAAGTLATITGGFSTCLLTKVIFRHVDTISKAAFFFNYGSSSSFTVLDFTLNEPGHQVGYNSGYGENNKYNRPTNVNDLWLGYNDNNYAWYARNYSYNDINILVPYLGGNAQNTIDVAYDGIVPDGHLYYDYGYTYMPDYKINDVSVGLYWLKPETDTQLTHGFFITKCTIRNLGDSYTISKLGASLVKTGETGDTTRYTYTVPDSLEASLIYHSTDPTGLSGNFLTTESGYTEVTSYQVFLQARSFKNITVAKDTVVDLNFADGITSIPSQCFLYTGFRNVYLNNVASIGSSAFDGASVSIMYAYKLTSIGNSCFYASSLTTLDMRENKDKDGNPIECTFATNFMYGSDLQAIYVDESCLDFYVNSTKGKSILRYDEEVELYIFFKVVGTFVGNVDLLNTSSYNLESLISPYEKDATEEVVWSITTSSADSGKFSLVDGVISVNIDQDSITKTPFEHGEATVYCIKNVTVDGNTTTTLLGKFDINIVTDETKLEYYNFVASSRTVDNVTKNGYKIISYYGTDITGFFNPSERFNAFMTAHITDYERSNYAILNRRINEVTEWSNNVSEDVYTLLEISQGSYMDMECINDTEIILYTNKYIETIPDYAFYLIPFNEVWCENVKTISRRAFYNSSSVNTLTTVVIPEIETIGSQAFYKDNEIKYVVIGDDRVSNLTTIGEYAFGLNFNLRKFGMLQENYTDEVNTYTWTNTKQSLYKAANHETGYTIDFATAYWVSDYSESENIALDGSVSYSYSNYSYYGYTEEISDNNYNYYITDGDRFIFLPNSVTSIGSYAFYKAIEIKEVRLPERDTFTTVGAYAFMSCTKLHYVRLEENVTAIGDYAFAYCELLTPADYVVHTYTSEMTGEEIEYDYHMDYTDGISFHYIKTIGNDAFRNCYSLDYIYLDAIESIGREAFKECENLRYINFENFVPTNEDLEKVSFGTNWDSTTHALRRYYVPAAYESYFEDAKYIYVRDINLKDLESDSNETYYHYQLKQVLNEVTNEVIGLKIVCYNGDVLVDIPSSFTINEINYPVVTIGKYAYHGFETNNLINNTLHLPQYVTKVEDRAFDSCLFAHYVENTRGANACVTYGSYVFSGNTALIDATFVRMIEGGEYFFNGCTAFTTFDISQNYDSSDSYYAPDIDDKFFTGSPSTCKCEINYDYVDQFNTPGYVGKIFAKSATKVDDYQVLETTNDSYIIVRYVGSTITGNYTVPTTLGGKSVVEINMGAYKDVDVGSNATLTIGSNIKKVGDYAFSNTGFASITFASGTGSCAIGNYAFADMTNLSTVDLTNVNSLGGTHVFENDTNLYIVSLHNGITSVPDYYFYNCSNMVNVDIGTACASIGEHAFDGCSCLKVIYRAGSNSISSSATFNLQDVTKIGDYAFQGCYGLEVLIATKLEEVGEYAFKNCIRLAALNFDTTSSLEYNTGLFYGCTALTGASIYGSYVPDYCFYGCTSLSSIYLGSATSIGASAFYNNTSLTSVDFGNVVIIGANAFRNCKALTTITLGKVETVGASAFYQCDLQGETINDEDHVLDLGLIKTIGNYAFGYNTDLKKVIFNHVQSIGSNAFQNDVYITEFDFTANYGYGDSSSLGIRYYNSSAFNGLNGDFIIYVPSDAVEVYENAFSPYRHRIFELGRTSSDGLYIVKDYTYTNTLTNTTDTGVRIIRYLGDSVSGQLDVPQTIDGDKVIAVGRYAYYNSYNENSITTNLNLGTNILEVGRYAFYNYEYTIISAPNVETIGSYAFYDNDSLRSLSLPSCVSIGSYAFANCNSLQLVRFYPCLKTLGSYAFYNCEDLRSVYFATVDFTNVTFKNADLPFGTLTNSSVIIRVPSGTITGSSTTVLAKYKQVLSYYASVIKEGQLSDADFSYRVVTDSNNETGVEIIAYEGQDTTAEIPATINVNGTDIEVVRILDNAFENALNLKSLKIPSTLKSISSHAFMGNTTISRITTTGSATTGFKSVGDCLYYVEGGVAKTLIYYPIAKTDTSYDFTDSLVSLSSVDMIYENAFYGNSYITDIKVPASVQYIGENAFAYCLNLHYVEFLVSGNATVPTLYGSNIFTNSYSGLRIVIANQTLLDLFRNDKYFGYYKSKMVSSRGSN